MKQEFSKLQFALSNQVLLYSTKFMYLYTIQPMIYTD